MTAEGTPAFDELLAPTRSQEFIDCFWEKQPLFIRRGDAQFYGHLLDRAQIQELFHYTCVDRRDARVVKEGRVYDDQSIFNAEGLANPLAIMGAYADGFTIVLNNVQRRHKAVASLCRSIEAALRHPIGANAYLTPSQSRGLAPHFDDHDVFILQLEGAKTWHLYAQAVELPLRGENVGIDRTQLGSPVKVCELHAGDLLYLPRGFVHEAVATQSSSLHLTLGISCYRWGDVLVRYAALRAKGQRAWRQALPARPRAVAETLFAEQGHTSHREVVQAAIAEIEMDFIHTLVPLADGGLEYLDSLGSITLDSGFRHRTGTICHIEVTSENARIHFPGNVVVCPIAVAPALAFVAEHTFFVARDLPSALSDISKLNIVRKLVTAGLLIPRECR